MTDYVYDIEIYVNCFVMGVQEIGSPNWWMFEISDWQDDNLLLIDFLMMLKQTNARLIGYNNLGFDWPVVWYFWNNIYSMDNIAYQLWAKAAEIIESDDRFGHIIWKPEIQQVDLYRINHFDNRARATSLKMLEFNMRRDVIEELPFPPNTRLTKENVTVLKNYNWEDIAATEAFYHESLDAIQFREQLSLKYGRDFLNDNDTKIGKQYFIMELERLRPGSCYTYDQQTGKRTPNQTHRDSIALRDVIFPYISFQHPEFQRIHNWMLSQTVIDANDIKDVSAEIDGFKFDFGKGGIHGSINNAIVVAEPEVVIMDFDVTSYYPSIAIVNRLHPEHLGETFCDIWADIKAQRALYTKGTVENKMLKLALNGSYGDLGNPYSPFLDMQCLLGITINGQLLLCMLAEWLMRVPGLELIQINTDGMTAKFHIDQVDDVLNATNWWQDYTKLDLESVQYSRMFIRDVNNYIGETLDGELKRKGAYEHAHPRNRNPVGWHQNLSAMVVPMAAEAYLVHGTSIDRFIYNHAAKNVMDFMLRTKVPRNSRLELGGVEHQRITRYMVTYTGGPLMKVSPPPDGCIAGQWKRANSLTDGFYNGVMAEIWHGFLKKHATDSNIIIDSTGRPWDERINTKNKSQYGERNLGIDVGYLVTAYNRIDAPIDRSAINFEYYIAETKKLTDQLTLWQ